MAVQMAAPIVWGGTSPSGHPRNSLVRQSYLTKCVQWWSSLVKKYLHSSKARGGRPRGCPVRPPARPQMSRTPGGRPRTARWGWGWGCWPRYMLFGLILKVLESPITTGDLFNSKYHAASIICLSVVHFILVKIGKRGVIIFITTILSPLFPIFTKIKCIWPLYD